MAVVDGDSGGRLYGAIYRRSLEANLVGAAVAFVYLTFVSPPQPLPSHDERLLYMALVPAFVALLALVGYSLGKSAFRPVALWLSEDRAPTEEERSLVLALPWRTAAHAAAGWGLAAAFFGVHAATHHPAVYVAGVVLGILLAGITSAAVTFLLCERTLRPVFARALTTESQAGGEPTGTLSTGRRLLVSWALGSGVALVAIAVSFLGRGDERGDDLIGPVLFLVIVGLFGGGVLLAAAARSVVDPVERVRHAVQRVEAGSLDEEVVVDDGGEIGSLQAGFNRMVAGLRERERIREVFGTYVDREVAEHILHEGTAFEGEEVEVTIMFVDIRDFTGYAERLSAREVVTTLNRLFERIVPIVHAHGGHVDKYIGDGLLAVFGAPRRRDDHADQAFAAGVEIAKAVDEEFAGELSVGIGLNSGPVVVGNVGGAGRLEFSVIGDAVNVAARVQSATRETGDVILVSEHTRCLLSDRAAGGLDQRPSIPLKGKRKPVALFAPERPEPAFPPAEPRVGERPG